MRAMFYANPAIRNVFHPDPGHSLIHTERGNLNVFQGERKAQLQDGSFIEV